MFLPVLMNGSVTLKRFVLADACAGALYLADEHKGTAGRRCWGILAQAAANESEMRSEPFERALH